MSTRKKLIIFIIALLVIDQVVKIWIKTHMMIGDEFSVFGDWFKIHFIENNGMAFGMELGGGKLGRLIKEKAPMGVILSFGLIFCGAIGNIIDSAFYGMIFSDSYSQVATMFPHGGGYSSFLHGKVVDMLYFPLYEGFLPQWIPIWGGDFFVFFRPVFNLADSYITIGVFILLLFHRKYFASKK